jgi:ubiquinone/menaquinone biosynthesis C-methylase UbiE
VTRHRDIDAFDERAHEYESGWRGKMHLEIATRSAERALTDQGTPKRVLDVGSGTGQLLRLLAERFGSDCELLAGIDPAEAMIEEAISRADDPRLSFSVGVAEEIAFPARHFDIVFATTSFDHWEDQRVGLTECCRVLTTGGNLVLTDLFSLWLTPTLLVRRGRVRTKHRATKLMEATGLSSVMWYPMYRPVLATAVATKRM